LILLSVADAIAPCCSFDKELPRLLRSQMKVKPRKLKVSGSEPAMSASFRRKAAELDQAGLSG